MRKEHHQLSRKDMTLEQGMEFLVCDPQEVINKYNVSKSTAYRIKKNVETLLTERLKMTTKEIKTLKIGF